MTKLAELKAAYEASTQGEWEQVGYNDLGRHVQTPEAGEICAIKRGEWKQIRNDEYKANANFIALAHNLMPTLIEAVAALDNLLDEIGLDHNDQYYITTYPDNDPVERARAVLEKLK